MLGTILLAVFASTTWANDLGDKQFLCEAKIESQSGKPAGNMIFELAKYPMVGGLSGDVNYTIHQTSALSEDKSRSKYKAIFKSEKTKKVYIDRNFNYSEEFAEESGPVKFRCYLGHAKEKPKKAERKTNKAVSDGKSLSVDWSSDRNTEIEMKALTGAERNACEKVISNLSTCAPSSCEFKPGHGIVRKFTIGGKKSGYCTFFENVSVPKNSNTILPSKLVRCSIMNEYMDDLRQYLEWNIRGGKASFTPCRLNKDGQGKPSNIESDQCNVIYNNNKRRDIMVHGRHFGFCAEDQI